ncbi:MAG: hypothetical protein ACE5I9_02560 [Candidatus Methylomirabilales bacterium]
MVSWIFDQQNPESSIPPYFIISNCLLALFTTPHNILEKGIFHQVNWRAPFPSRRSELAVDLIGRWARAFFGEPGGGGGKGEGMPHVFVGETGLLCISARREQILKAGSFDVEDLKVALLGEPPDIEIREA